MSLEVKSEEEVISFDCLYESYRKCVKGVSWKPSVKAFMVHDEHNLLLMEEQLKNGTWKNGKPKPITITYPKRREALSVSFRDRIYQRSINDNVLYPAMTKSFIYENCACQKGKGIDFARNLFKKQLWKFYRNNGLSGYVLQVDIKGYYANMRHDKVIEIFGEKIEPEMLERIKDILDNQYSGEKGYNPGSQMVQIAGISYLNKLDHKIKEKYHVECYQRYMDDMMLIHQSKEYLEYVLEQIKVELAELGLEVNVKKTHIQPISKAFTYLGFKYRLTETGKVIMSVDTQNVKHERRKLNKMLKKVKRGELTLSKTNECFDSWKNHASKGNSYKLTCRMNNYFNNTRKELDLAW